MVRANRKKPSSATQDEWVPKVLESLKAWADDFKKEASKWELPGMSTLEQKAMVERLQAVKGRVHCRALIAAAAGIDPFLDMGDLAAVLALPLETTRKYVTTGTIPLVHYRIGSSYRVRKRDVLEWMERIPPIRPPDCPGAIGLPTEVAPEPDSDTSKDPRSGSSPVPVSLRHQS